MKQLFIKGMMLLLIYNLAYSHHRLLTNPTLALAGVSLFCLITYGKELMHDIAHKKCIFNQTKNRYERLYHDININGEESCFVLRPPQDLKKLDFCECSINIVPDFLAQRYSCIKRETYAIEYTSEDRDAFAIHIFFKKIRYSCLGCFVGLFGCGISMYNFCMNNYKL